MAKNLGIDFGTQELRLAILEEGQPRLLGTVLPIWKAAGLDHAGYAIPLKVELDDEHPIRLGSASLSRADLATRIFSHARNEAEKILGESVTGCVIGIPSQAGNLHRQILRSATRKAGFRSFGLINETLAVALSQSPGPEKDRQLLIYNMGASTLDISIAVRSPGALRELVSGGRKELSGESLTQRLHQYLFNEYHLHDEPEWPLRVTAEQLKILLSKQEQVALVELAPEFSSELIISRQIFEELIQPDIQSSLELCQDLLTRAQINSPAELDEIWLVGKSTSIPLIRSRLAAWSGKELCPASEEAIAFGAAIYTPSLDSPEAEDLPETEQPKAANKSPLWLFKSPGTMPTLTKKDVPTEDPTSPSRLMAAHLQDADRCLANADFDGALLHLIGVADQCKKQLAEIHFLRGKALENEGRIREAQADYQHALKLDPEHPQARLFNQNQQHQEARIAFQRGRQLEGQGKLSEAFQYYQEASRKHQENSEYHNRCASILLEKANRKSVTIWNEIKEKRIQNEKASKKTVAIISDIQGRRIQNANFIRGSINEARKWLQQAKECQPTSLSLLSRIQAIEKELVSLEKLLK